MRDDMSTREDYIAAVGILVQGDFPLGEPERIKAITQALDEHSKHRPLVITEDESGTGSFDYAISLLGSWSETFSDIIQIEYPVDDSLPIPNVLDGDAWQIYIKPAGKFMRFLNATPSSRESFRVSYTTPHTCTDAACTVATADDEAVHILAAAFFCDMLSTYFAQTTDSTIQADSVDHKSKSRDYAARAKECRRLYASHMDLKDGDTASPATAVVDLSEKYPGGLERLTHPRWARNKR
jgi:hypothetical protein